MAQPDDRPADGSRRLRILHIPVDLGGHPQALATAQRKLGHDAVCVSLSHSRFGFNGDQSHDAPLNVRGRLVSREIARLKLLRTSLIWADVVHCHFGQTLFSLRAQPIRDTAQTGIGELLKVAAARLLWLHDLPLWRAAGKRVVMTCYGDDVRRVDLSIPRNAHTHLALPGLHQEAARRDPWKRKLVDRLARYGVPVFATNPDLLVGLPAGSTFVPYGNVDASQMIPSPPRPDGPLRFVHMPSDRDVKGTSMFISAVEQLRNEGIDCSLTLVEGVTNAEALGVLRDHDVLLDQLRVGWFGAVSVEAMAMAKPAVAYLHPEDKLRTPAGYAAALPVFEASPETILPRLRALAMEPRQRLVALGMASRQFVESWHAPERIAQMMIDTYRRS